MGKKRNQMRMERNGNKDGQNWNKVEQKMEQKWAQRGTNTVSPSRRRICCFLVPTTPLTWQKKKPNGRRMVLCLPTD